MSEHDTSKVQAHLSTRGSASDRALELLLDRAHRLHGINSASVNELRKLYGRDCELTGNDIVSILFPPLQAVEGQAHVANKEN